MVVAGMKADSARKDLAALEQKKADELAASLQTVKDSAESAIQTAQEQANIATLSIVDASDAAYAQQIADLKAKIDEQVSASVAIQDSVAPKVG